MGAMGIVVRMRALALAIAALGALGCSLLGKPDRAPAPDPQLQPLGIAATDGGELQFDGAVYSYRDAEALKSMSLWVPPGDAPVRGILFHGNPGGNGENRGAAYDANLQEFAARFRFGILGVANFPGNRVYAVAASGERTGTGQTILDVLAQWAALGHHPELAHVPLLPRGSSNAGQTAYSLASLAPERIVAFTPNVGPRYIPFPPPDALLQVPAMMHVAPRDQFYRNGMTDTRKLFEYARPRGALWAWDAEQNKTHELGHCDDLDMAFYAAVIPLRVPAGADFRKGPVALTPIRPETGWLVNQDSWSSGTVQVAPWASYAGDKARAGWVLNRDLAYLYRAVATYDDPVSLTLTNVTAVTNALSSGRDLRSVGGSVVDQGSQIKVECHVGKLTDWQRIEFFDGGVPLRTVLKGSEPICTFTVDGRKRVYALTALVHYPQGVTKPARPVHFLVRDVKISKALAAQRAGLEPMRPGARPAWGSAAGPGEAPKLANPDAALVAWALTASEESGFGAVKDRVADFWQAWGDRPGEVVHIVPERHGTRPASDTNVYPPRPPAPPAPGSARLAVRAAHSRAGLYFLFEVEDSEWVPARGGADCVDFHVARDNTERIRSAAQTRDVFLSPLTSLLVSEMQYQCAFGTPEQPGTELNRNVPSPWFMRPVRETLADAAKDHGIVVRQARLTDGRRAMEWFVPWDYVGVGGPYCEPTAGTTLALALGYDDGHTAPQPHTQTLRWPSGGDPWWRPAAANGTISPWGDLLIGPAVPKQ